MIVRVMGEGQFEIDDEVAKGLNDLDEQAEQALQSGDRERLTELLERMAEAVRTNGTRVPDDDLSPSEGDRPAARPDARGSPRAVRRRGPDPGPSRPPSDR